MAAIDTLINRLLPHVQGCSEPLARSALLDTARDFCERTDVLRVTQDPTDVLAGIPEVDLDVPAGMTLCRVLKVFFDDGVMDKAPLTFVDNPFAYYASVAGLPRGRGTPITAYMLSDTQIGLSPAPAESLPQAVTVVMSIKPAMSATAMPQELVEHWTDALVDGARARLYGHTGAVFANPAMQQLCQASYLSAVSRAKSVATKGRIQAPTHVRPRSFA